jgi:uncharacterized protein with von Willebrand factor type A (vWA) domain
LDISQPQHWQIVKSFLKNVFTGGTDGEKMLACVLQTLNTENYSMADVLVISDFEFNLPSPQTRKKIKEEQKKGTCFYGLQIGKERSRYENIMDKIWNI